MTVVLVWLAVGFAAWFAAGVAVGLAWGRTCRLGGHVTATDDELAVSA